MPYRSGESNRSLSYEARFISFFNWIEKGIVLLLLAALFLLFLSQFALRFDTMRYIVSPIDRLEGKLVDPTQENIKEQIATNSKLWYPNFGNVNK